MAARSCKMLLSPGGLPALDFSAASSLQKLSLVYPDAVTWNQLNTYLSPAASLALFRRQFGHGLA
ncbi:hypothetical protein A2U01_0048094, partial [Trifolium medium]|nr:hypothetical protein [Trifolium medium]